MIPEKRDERGTSVEGIELSKDVLIVLVVEPARVKQVDLHKNKRSTWRFRKGEKRKKKANRVAIVEEGGNGIEKREGTRRESGEEAHRQIVRRSVETMQPQNSTIWALLVNMRLRRKYQEGERAYIKLT